VSGVILAKERDEVFPGLFVGRFPDFSNVVTANAQLVDVDALAVVIRTEPVTWPPFLDVLQSPLTDDAWEIIAGDKQRAETVSHWIAGRLRNKRNRVLAVCREGLNRSAWVAALAIQKLTHCSGKAAAEHVKARRPGSLYNGPGN